LRTVFDPSTYPQAVPYFSWYSIGREVCKFSDMGILAVRVYIGSSSPHPI
jgi:hypothetical protein